MPRPIACLSAAVGLLLFASSAQAANYCVNKPGCIGTSTSLENALALADDNVDEDFIYIGANGGVPYSRTDNFSGIVHLIGDGPGQTILQGGTAANINDRQTLTLLGSSGHTLSDMTIRSPTGQGGGERALVFRGTASRVELIQEGAPGQSAVDGRGDATLEDSTLTSDVRGIFSALNGTTLTVRDSTISAPSNLAVDVPDAGTLMMQRTLVVSGGAAVEASGAATTTTLTNVVVRKTTSSAGNSIVRSINGATTTVRHATIIGAGGGRGVDVDNSPNTDVTMHDSIITNVAVPIFCASNDDAQPSSMTVRYSNFGPGSDTSDAGCSASFANNDNTTTPAFVDAVNGDYRLLGGSPLINAADPADPIANDFDNVARPIGGRSDMGAYEYRARAPQAVITAPATANAGETVAFSGNGTDEDGDPLTYAWDFGDGGAGGAGADVTHVFAPGTYDVTLTVTDSAGLSATATSNIVVNDVSQPPPPPTPKMSGLKADPKTVKARKQAPKLVVGGTRGLVFSMNTAAKITLTLERCKGKRGCSRKKDVPGSAAFDAPAGASAIVFKGSLDGKKKLRKGRYVATLTPTGGDAATAKLKVK